MPLQRGSVLLRIRDSTGLPIAGSELSAAGPAAVAARVTDDGRSGTPSGHHRRARVQQNWVAAEVGFADPGVYVMSRLGKSARRNRRVTLGERGFELLQHERMQVSETLELLRTRMLTDPQAASAVSIPVDQAGASAGGARCSAPPAERKTSVRRRLAATPDRETVVDESELPEREIPAHYYELGARLIEQCEGHSMVKRRDHRSRSAVRQAVGRCSRGARGSEHVKLDAARGRATRRPSTMPAAAPRECGSPRAG